MATTVKRISAGHYTVGNAVLDGGYVVDIKRRSDLRGWVASALWDRHLYTDAVPTLWDAKRNARSMIEDQMQDDARRVMAQNAHLRDDRLLERIAAEDAAEDRAAQ